MASKRTKAVRAAAASHLPPSGDMNARFSSSSSSIQGSQGGSEVRINSYVDVDRNMDELFQRNERYVRNPTRRAFPPSYFQQPSRPTRSSASHSPNGSSDDGFSTSRNTLSPSFLGGTAPQNVPYHKKQFSAPELDNRFMEVPALPSTTPSLPSQQIPQHRYSVSVSAINAASSHEMTSYPPAAQHARSMSYDVNHAALNGVNPFGGGSFTQTPSTQQAHSNQDLFHPSLAHPQQRAKSVSLDPMTMTAASQQQSQQTTAHPPLSNICDGLPPNWSAAYNETGEIYYMDHEHQTTTWFHPCIPRHEQEEAIRAKHGTGAAAHTRAASAHAAVMSPMDMQMQSPAPHHGYAQQGFDTNQGFEVRMQELDAERAAMEERERQLKKMGLVKSPQMYNPTSPVQMGNNNMNHAYYAHQQPHMAQTAFDHTRNISNDSALMEVDYVARPHEYIDPSMAGGLVSQSTSFHMYHSKGIVNPDELNQYLGEKMQIHDHLQPQTIPRYQ